MKTEYINPLIKNASPDADLLSGIPYTLKKPKSAKRDIRDLRRKQTAAQAVSGLDVDTEIFGFTKGQFSSIDLIEAVIGEIKAPAEYMAISTWAAAKTDVHQTLDMMHSGKVKSARWLIDYTFQRRMPGLAQEIRSCFGEEAIRVAKNHAKFTLIQSGNWRIVIRTSMNLNYNPRFEDFTIAHDPQLFDFINGILNEVWRKQDKRLAFENAGKIESHFDELL
jgi:hypothetical protein